MSEEKTQNSMGPTTNSNLKYLSLVTLTVQNSAVALSMRYARTRPGDMFIASTAVVSAEFVKLLASLYLVFHQVGSLQQFIVALQTQILKQKLDTLKVAVPSFIYLVQNNLLYVSASNLDAATYQVTYQMKILTTAMFAVLILGSDVSIWIRNVQLSFLSLPLGVLTALANDWSSITSKGFFYAYDSYIIYLIVLNAVGGLLVAMVVKYADNILKGFATSLAIVLSTVFSVFIFDFMISIEFVVGTVFVMASIFLYSYEPPKKSPSTLYLEKV
ncbi:UDP-N-acetylglucosamine transporter [Armadillidium nasatum]|uniref:UDP-N-acetylglucosamine transporter n=1 Tax=Armadillidium nasatum TaxID=96803 RepID=A0A5N5T578_9CRUS|nr:UDP-N-acetylglucosamine transporter [Armadillidium nasatum]